MEPVPTVFLVDDDPEVIETLTELVRSIGLRAESYQSAEEFLSAYRRDGPGCLVLDVRMPGLSGLQLQAELARTSDALPIIFITGYADVRMAVEALKAGAFEFLEKPFRMQQLCDNIQKAIRIDQENWRCRQQQQQVRLRLAGLTPAEREVMALVVAGKTNKMIAAELGLSLRAIEDRRARMMRKLQVQSRAELAELAGSVASKEHSDQS